MMWRSLRLAVALAAACSFGSVGCGSDVVVEPSASAVAGVGGAQSSSSAASGQGGAAIGAGGTGGGRSECDGAVIAVDNGQAFDQACSENSRTSCVLGYYALGGPPGSATLVIEGCYGRGRRHPFLLEVPADYQQLGTWSNAELVVDIYWTSPRNTSVTVTTVDDVGGFIEGTFDTVLYQIDQDMPATGTFRVIRVADLL